MTKKYIVAQIIVDSMKQIENTNDIRLSNVIRQVYAKNKEEAIGKFVISTAKEIGEVHKKLEIECYSIQELKEIK